MATPLTPVPDCIDQEPCVPLELTLTGNEVAVADQLTQCIKRLQNRENAVLWTDGERVTWVTGEGDASLQLILDKLKTLGDGFPKLVVASPGGSIGVFHAENTTQEKVLVSFSGGWSLKDFLPPACFKEDQICECESDWVVGVEETEQPDGSIKWCLVRYAKEQLVPPPPLYFASSATVQVTGTGTQGNPYKFNVKLANEAGNIIESHETGIFAECCEFTYEDLIEVL